jgi:hypothetical protein
MMKHGNIKKPDGQSAMEFTVALVIVILLAGAMTIAYRWASVDLGPRKNAYMTALETDFIDSGSRRGYIIDDPDTFWKCYPDCFPRVDPDSPDDPGDTPGDSPGSIGIFTPTELDFFNIEQ